MHPVTSPAGAALPETRHVSTCSSTCFVSARHPKLLCNNYSITTALPNTIHSAFSASQVAAMTRLLCSPLDPGCVEGWASLSVSSGRLDSPAIMLRPVLFLCLLAAALAADDPTAPLTGVSDLSE